MTAIQSQADLLWNLPVDRIVPSPFQPRHFFNAARLQQLADDIALNGLLQPITCRPISDRFEIIYGERRWRAVQLIAGRRDIQAKLIEADDHTARRMCYAENLTRDDLSSVEEAEAVMAWLDNCLEQDAEYMAQGTTPIKRVAWVLTKLFSDHTNKTDHFTNRFVSKVEAAFAQLPKRMDWRSYYAHDLILVTSLSEEVKRLVAEEKLNKSQAKALQAVLDDSPETFNQIANNRTVTVLDRDTFTTSEQSLQDVSAREIRDAARKAEAENDRLALDAKTAHLIFSAGKFSVICADPPWSYSNSGFEQSAASHYPTMTTEAICALPVPALCTAETVLFLWATSPLLPDALAVLAAWGFGYKASMVWDKGHAPGIGWFLRTEHEFLLIGTKDGNRHPTVKPGSVFRVAPTEHSAKPAEVYATIESMYGGPYIELFARAPRPGWEVWGNET